MNTPRNPVILYFYFLSILIVIAMSVYWWSYTPPLVAYGIDIQQTSVSGVSSGGAMAVQMHVAHSSKMRGVG